METVTLSTPSAHCGSCRANIKESMEEVAGVRSADLDLETRETTVIFDPEVLDERAVRSAISEAGYPPEDDQPVS